MKYVVLVLQSALFNITNEKETSLNAQLVLVQQL